VTTKRANFEGGISKIALATVDDATPVTVALGTSYHHPAWISSHTCTFTAGGVPAVPRDRTT